MKLVDNGISTFHLSSSFYFILDFTRSHMYLDKQPSVFLSLHIQARLSQDHNPQLLIFKQLRKKRKEPLFYTERFDVPFKHLHFNSHFFQQHIDRDIRAVHP